MPAALSKIDPEKKQCGVLIPVFALRRNADLGIGDTAGVKEAIDFCARNALSGLQVLPINETSGDNSPYGAISSVALDPVLLALEPESVPGLLPAEFERIVSESGIRDQANSSVDYKLVKKLKLDLLRSAFAEFKKGKESKYKAEHAELRAFLAKHQTWLEDYTLFRTLIDVHGGNPCWTQWSVQQQSPEAARDWLNASTIKAKLEDDRNFHSYVQWLAFRQWQELRKYADEKGVWLMGDIPFGVSRYSADVWSCRQLFELDWSGGAPPENLFQGDPFTAKWGQNWGIPVYNWKNHKKENYRWWRQRVGRLTEIFHYFRIDHVLGFFRIYSFPWIPERNHEFLELSEEEAKKLTKGRLPQFLPRDDYPEKLGKLNAEEGKHLLEMILEAAGDNGVVAEDLGTVPPYVRPLLRELGIPGFFIPIFERDEESETLEFKSTDEMHPLSLGTYGTHDHMPIAMYYEDLVRRWHGENGHEAWLDVQRLMRFLGLDDENPPLEFTDDLHEAFEKVLLDSPCWLALFMIPDILGTKEQFNVPGQGGAGNWSQRLAMSLNDYERDVYFGAKIKRLSGLIKSSGRLISLSPTSTIK